MDQFWLFPRCEAAFNTGLSSSIRHRKKSISTKKAKIGISPPQSPLSVSSFNGKPQNGFFNSSTASTPRKRSVSDTSEGGVDGHFKFLEGYSTYPEVFTISSGTGSPTTDSLSRRSEKSQLQGTGSLGTSSVPEDKYKWTETASADETKHRKTKSRKLCVILLVTTLVIGLLAGVAVILAFKVFGVGEPSEEKLVTTIRPDILLLDGSLDLMETWQPELDDPTSPLYIETANNFTSEMDVLMQNSVYNDSYINTVVIDFSPGSIQAKFNMRFDESYKLRSENRTKFAQLIQNDLRTNADKTSLRINKGTVYIEAIEKLTTPTSSTASTDSTTSSTIPSTISSSITSTNLSSTTTPISPTTNSTSPTLSTTTETVSTNASTSPTSTSTTLSSASSTVLLNTTKGISSTTTSSSITRSSTSSNTTSELTTLSTVSATSPHLTVASTTTTSTTGVTTSSTSTTQSSSTPNMTTLSTVSSTTSGTPLSSTMSSTMSSINTTSSSTISSSTSNMTTSVTTESSTTSSKSSTTPSVVTSISTTSSTPSTTTSVTTESLTSLKSSTTPSVTTESSTTSSTPSTTASVTTENSTTSSAPSTTASVTTESSTTSSTPSTTTSVETPSSTTSSTKSTTPSIATSSSTISSTSSSTSPTTTTMTESTSSSTSSTSTSTTPSTTTTDSTSSSKPSTTTSTTTATESTTSTSTTPSTTSTESTSSSTPSTTPSTTTAESTSSSTPSTTTSTTTATESTTSTSTTPSTTSTKSTSSSTPSTTPSTTTTESTSSSTPSTTTSTTTTTESTTSTSTTPSTTTTAKPDARPTANAGPDVTITLPVNTVYLYGNGSTDDREVTQYMWQKVSNLPADMRGTRSSILYVTNLVAGTYVFKLTVRDRRGQSDRDTVVVTVKQAEPDSPPTANAGPDITITLPVNSAYLYGNSSSDDREITQYMWQKETNLPADMNGMQSSILYVENLVEGVYTFKLTVRDRKGQSDHDTVLVTVNPAPTTSTTATTTPADTCLEVTSETCRKRGFTHTLMPNLMGHDTVQEAVSAFDTDTSQVMNQLCQEVALTYLCSLYFPKCDQNTGDLYFPCASLCLEATRSCEAFFTNPFECNVFEVDVPTCIQQVTTTEAPTTTTQAPDCEPTVLNDCTKLGFTETIYPNYFHEPNQTVAIESFDLFFKDAVYSLNVCSEKFLYFICSIQFPKCIAGVRKSPCQRTCQEIVTDCPDYQYFFYCDDFPEIDCVAPPEQPLDCRSDEFSCGEVSKCVPDNKVCDGVNDCGDYTDEMDCTCEDHHYKCAMGMCIKLFQRCDGIIQCPDKSDEDNCKCKNGQIACPDGTCIMSEWRCDDFADCSDGWDEINCEGNCTSSQFRCKDHSCLDRKKVCNLKEDCADGDDEWDCIRQDAFLRLRHKKFFLPLCATNWQEGYGEYTCGLLGMGSYIGYSERYSNGYMFYQLPDNSSGTEPSVLGPLELTRCRGKKAVVVNCQPRGCGKMLAPGIVNFIVNGETAAKGAWPWQVGLYYGDQYFCGGTLINRNFVLTAAHCVEVYKLDFRLMTVKLGAHNRIEQEVTQHVVAVEAIKSHREHVYFEKNDIALLQLANPVNFTTYIQPVCLPEKDETLPLYSLCYTIGWGKTKWDGEYAEVLQQLKMTLWDTQKCNSSVAWNGEVYDTFLCAGYVSGVRSICKGDSGGPLLCLDKTLTWKVIGVSSYVANYCNMTDRPNIFTDVRHFIPWIEDNLECRFRCTNGKCLYNLDQVCDRVDNCGDNSDEDRECNKTVQCDFEDKYLCGYTFSGWKVGFDNKLALRTIIDGQVHTQSYAPQFDHTVGRYPGHFLYGKEKNYLSAKLESPVFTTTGQTCIRFYYYLRGEISIGFTAKLIEYHLSKNSTTKSSVRSGKIQNAKDEWKMAYFDVTPGEYRVKFLAGDLFKTAIDDIQMIPGMCKDVLCDETQEFWCKSLYGDKCISKQSRCDLAVECDFAFDEKDCPSPTNSYLCTFDNGNLCSLRQDVDDASDWWFMNASNVQKEIRDPQFFDHSTGLINGYVLYLNTYILQADTNVYMRQTFKLDYHQYCLSFHYQMQTDATFEIHLDCNGCKSTTHTVMETFVGWTLYQMELPLVDTLKVTYDAHASSEIDSFYFSFIAIDDLTVTPGVCPSYVCPGNLAKCRTLNRCVPRSVLCDREVNCLDESDEENCVCNANEFQCTSGRCIDLEKKCNKVTDCLDGSDEGNTCVALNDVSCTFEHPYMCGYEFVTSSEYTWLRHRGPTPTPITGPHADHTLGTSFGYYVYTEANQGSQGDKSSFVSPEFYSGFGMSLEFYYHIFSTRVNYVNQGSLIVSLEDSDTKEEIVLWKSTMHLFDRWQDLCLDLPQGIRGRIVFTATRCNETIYGVDKAIDDITLQNHLCSDMPETTTPPPTTTTTTEATTSGSGCPSDEWLCGNGVTCVKASYRCDNMSDCPDGSDEQNCP